jgi:hypothetical protein
MTNIQHIRCVVKVDGQIESILEGEASIIFDHVEETLQAYEEDTKSEIQLIITHPHQCDPITDELYISIEVDQDGDEYEMWH